MPATSHLSGEQEFPYYGWFYILDGLLTVDVYKLRQDFGIGLFGLCGETTYLTVQDVGRIDVYSQVVLHVDMLSFD